MYDENIAKFSITNGELTDVGIVYISEFFQKKGNLHVLKLYNNIMRTTVTNNYELAYIINGTPSLANCIMTNTKLTCLELHGFFLH